MSANKKRKAIAMLEQKYGYSKSNPCTIQIKNSFDNVVDSFTSINVIECSYADLALVKFEGFNQLFCNSFPVFKDNSTDLKQGLSLCRLGFPYTGNTNFQYNSITDDIEWTTAGNPNSPLFPIDGIITRYVAENGQITGLELSTPGLKGQSGGPLFDKQGVICGLQSSTVSLPLGFDQVNREIMIDGKKIRYQIIRSCIWVGAYMWMLLKNSLMSKGLNIREDKAEMYNGCLKHAAT